MLLTFANVERRLDPAQAKSQLQPSSALALLWLCSFCGPLGSDCPSLTSLPCLPCLSVRRGVGQSSVRSSLLKPCALQMLLMLLLLLLPFFLLLFPSFSFCSFRYCLTAGHGALKLVFRLWLRLLLPLHSQHVRALIICTRLLSLPLCVCVFLLFLPWPGLVWLIV